MPFTFDRLAIPEIILIEPRVFGDARGFFMETYKYSDFAAAGIDEPLNQENHSKSARGTLRGLHYQREPHGQGKLVRVVAGEIYDVAVDIRPDSPTRGKWVGVTLSADSRRMLYLPPWCAHGFCVTSETAEVIYKTTAEYRPDLEFGVMWNDPALKIDWPLTEPLLSERDKKWPPFR
jgi:dTDP-4-dehydrorhamnose 3,5-epimerase